MRMMVWTTLFSALLSPMLAAETIETTLHIPPSELLLYEAQGYTRVELEGAPVPDLTPGEPRLPVLVRSFLLPAGSTLLRVDVTASEETVQENLLLLPAQPITSINAAPRPLTPPDPAIYASTAPWPTQNHGKPIIQQIRGRTLVSLRLHPLRYLPAQQTLLLAHEMHITLHHTAPARQATEPALSPLFAGLINSLVVNPEAVPRTHALGTNQTPYIIITSTQLAPAFQPLANLRTNSFAATAVLTLGSLLAETPGIDNPDRLRNAIRNLVASNAAEYIVLGGDDSIVPVRGCFAIDGDGDEDPAIPTDLYYAGLDGNWDANGNHIYGEIDDNVDMLPDVIVSRIPVRTSADTAAYIQKLAAWENGDFESLENKLLLSGTKGWNLWYGTARSSDYMGDGYTPFRQHQPVSDVEEWVRRVHQNMIQPGWSAADITIYFDTLTSWDAQQAGDYQQTADRFAEAYNLGWEHYYYLTHGDNTGFAIEMVDGNDMFTNENLDAVTNMVPFISTPACQTAHFDGTPDPCFAEAFLRKPHSGALIYYAHARNGQGDQLSTYGGPTPEFIAYYYQRLFNGVSTTFGEAYAAGKADLIALCNTNGAWRWTQFGLNLLGDPAIQIRQSPIPHPPILESAVSTNTPALAILLEWSDASTNETGFEIQRRIPPNDWTALTSTAAGVTQYLDTTVLSNTFHFYRLRAVNNEGASLFSNEGGLLAGIIEPDSWDPADNTPAGATILTNLTETDQAHGPHTLSINDTNDWFAFEVEAGMAYWFSTYAEENAGGLYARVYDTNATLIAEDGDPNGLGHFAFFLTPEEDSTYLLQIEPNNDRDSAFYNLYSRAAVNTSSSEALGEALDAPDLPWLTSTQTGDPWFAQTNVTHGTPSAVRSAQVYYNETSWIQTIVPENANLHFWFKTDTLENHDYMTIYVAGMNIATYSGQNDWTLFSTYAEAGSTVRVEYARSSAGSSGENAVWLDQFSLSKPEQLAMNTPFEGYLADGASLFLTTTITVPGKAQILFSKSFTGLTPSLFDAEDQPIEFTMTPFGIEWDCRQPTTCGILLKAVEGNGDFSLFLRQRHEPINDYDGDSVTDLALYYAEQGLWCIGGSAGETETISWGCNAAIPAAGDYNADGEADIAVYFPETGAWVTLLDQAARTINWGWNEAIPVQADYHGDGITDPAVYHPETGTWYIHAAKQQNQRTQAWGWSEAIPVPGDFDGDGRADFCVYWPAKGHWYILYASGRSTLNVMGWTETIPMAADVDGDFADDLLLYWPKGGMWYILPSSTGVLSTRFFGWSEALPVPGRYFSNQPDKLALYWPAGGAWYLRNTAQGSTETRLFGWPQAFPVYPQHWIQQKY
ncbi:MAG: C25 family cysteine peptidase [Kiritimatiellae bacterium]|nr:C25 family cysteine peptidase [Kiritimatiellia bacterium]